MLSTSTPHTSTADPDSLILEKALVNVIQADISQSGGQISFSRFMELALYEPNLGYYANSLTKIGSAGDFITAPEVSPLFAQCLAKQCQQVLATLEDGCIIEFGAGNGTLAADLLNELAANNCLPTYYYIIELSGHLRARQEDWIKKQCPQHCDRVVWLNSLENFSAKGVVIANEVLDAMPAHRFHISPEHSHEYYVRFDGERFYWQLGETSNETLMTFMAKLRRTLAPEALPYCSEVNLFLKPWLQTLSDILKQGLVILIDYGYPVAEYYHPQRNMGTLMCHHQHRAHDDPLVSVGLQDITTHVDFSAAAEYAEAAGFKISGYTNQAFFLLSCGITDKIITTTDIQAVKRLTLPHEMGELFKVLALVKDFDEALIGFQQDDKRGRF